VPEEESLNSAQDFCWKDEMTGSTGAAKILLRAKGYWTYLLRRASKITLPAPEDPADREERKTQGEGRGGTSSHEGAVKRHAISCGKKREAS